MSYKQPRVRWVSDGKEQMQYFHDRGKALSFKNRLKRNPANTDIRYERVRVE